jgi:HEXXH motif-containing protein
MPATVDWARLVKPQADGYDTATIRRLVEEEPPPWPSERSARQAPANAPRLADGRVVIDNRDPLLPVPRWRPVDDLHPNLVRAIELVGCWPEAARQWPQLVHTVQCFIDSEPPAEKLYSASHSVADRWGVIAFTVHCPLATAQAIVHEMAHTKLRALGVDNERATRIIANPPAERFASPVVVDQPRPMSAVLHAQYSFIHVTHLDLCMLEHESDAAVRADMRTLLGRNLRRMKAGFATLREHAVVDRDGSPFLTAFLDWCQSTIDAGDRALA